MHEGFKCPNPHPLKMNIIFLLFLYVFFVHMYLWSFYMIIIFIQILNYDISESLPFLLFFFLHKNAYFKEVFLSENIGRIVVQTTHIHPRRIADSNIFICFFVLNNGRNFFFIMLDTCRGLPSDYTRVHISSLTWMFCYTCTLTI